MQTSPKGRAFLRSHEGDVRRAYRCPAGILTIGVGLTKASGVVDPKPGMVITREQSDELLSKALARNYEPRVAKTMTAARQNEFDGGISFDFNTGAIHKASWVASWRSGLKEKVRAGLGSWNKGGGKVLAGLVRRRREEADIILLDKWPADLNFAVGMPLRPADQFARFVISANDAEIEAVRDGLRKLGLEPGPEAGKVLRTAVETFQRKYRLTVDGLIGRATIATLQRELDARAKTLNIVAVSGGGTAAAGGNTALASDAAADQLLTWIGVAAIAAALVYGAWTAWQYRDIVAAKIDGIAPRLAAWLRSR